MSKEYLEAFGRIALHTEYDNDGSYDSLNFEDDCKLVDNALQRLEQIDNANPSEALECLDFLGDLSVYYDTGNLFKLHFKEEFDTIKRALIKQQEPKHYLKWEDLEFKEEPQKMKVKLGDSLYRIEWYSDGCGVNGVFIYKYITNDYLEHCTSITDNRQQFFNDLRLERVEE